MKIAFYGSSLLSSYWNGAATYYRGMIRDLHARGYRTTFYEPDAFDRQQHRDIDPPGWAEVVVYPASDEGVDAVRIFWDVDAPATLPELRQDRHHALHGALPGLDFVFTYGGGPPVVAAYEALGARRCVPIYNALDPTTHHPVPAEPAFEADLSFLGNRLPDREARVERFFLDAAARLPNRSFLIGGNGWETKDMPGNVRHIGHVYTRQHNAFNTSSLAVLNIARDSMAAVGYSPATRVFEAAGAGACLVTAAWVGLDLFLQEGDEVLVARDGADVAAHVAALTPDRAREIGEAARHRILRHHTYERRGAEVDALLKRHRAERSERAGA